MTPEQVQTTLDVCAEEFIQRQMKHGQNPGDIGLFHDCLGGSAQISRSEAEAALGRMLLMGAVTTRLFGE